MASLLTAIATFLVLAGTSSRCWAAQYSSSPSNEEYWKTTLPRTPIPSFIQDLMTSDVQGTFSLKSRMISPTDVILLSKALRALVRLVLPDNPNIAGFLLKEDLRPGTTLTMQLGRTTGNTAFFTRSSADSSLPFSSADVPRILARYNVTDPDSLEGKVIRETLQICDAQAAQGETRRCATSLESMVKFAASAVGITGNDLMTAISTTSTGGVLAQQYTIVPPGPEVVVGKQARSVACHPLTFPFAVYSCHSVDGTEVYRVPLVGRDGSRVAAVVTCHMSTASWDPGHVSFRVLKVKPGVPICHFFAEDNLVWTRGSDERQTSKLAVAAA